MPRLMEKKDWLRTVAEVGPAERIWYESVSGDGGLLPLSLPESGMYQVFLIKVDNVPKGERLSKKSARDYIGYCRRNYDGRRTTAEIMKELREGEE